jgi:S1-C subfamily serine protease
MKSLFPLFAMTLLGAAQAAEPAARAQPAAKASATASARAAAFATPAEQAAARAELDQLREEMRQLGRRMSEISLRLGDGGSRNFAWRYLGDSDRALLGVVLRNDDKGLQIAAVTPGGPADKAGVRNEDILLAIDGRKLSGENMSTALETLRELKVDQEVKLTLLRSGKEVVVVAKAARREAQNWPRVMVGADLDVDLDIDRNITIDTQKIRRDVEQQLKGVRHEIERSLGSDGELQRLRNLRINLMPWWGINLASLNPELAAYFGTDKGVLVLSADADSMPGLKGGDILQSVDGNSVDDPSDVMRQLRDARAGSEVKLGVLRQKKTLTLNTKVPEYKNMFPLPPEPPAPPARPAPPAAPAAPAPPAPPSPPPPPPVPAPPAVPAFISVAPAMPASPAQPAATAVVFDI